MVSGHCQVFPSGHNRFWLRTTGLKMSDTQWALTQQIRWKEAGKEERGTKAGRLDACLAASTGSHSRGPRGEGLSPGRHQLGVSETDALSRVYCLCSALRGRLFRESICPALWILWGRCSQYPHHSTCLSFLSLQRDSLEALPVPDGLVFLLCG